MPGKKEFINYIGYKVGKSSPENGEGLAFLQDYLAAKKDCPGFPFVFFCDHIPTATELSDITGHGDVFKKRTKPLVVVLQQSNIKDLSACWQLLDMGVDDVIEWGESGEIVEYLESKYQRNKLIKETLDSTLVKANLVGSSTVWKQFLEGIIETALFSAASVLLIGESGTGKELLARLLHTLDAREDKKKLIIVDCTTIVPELSGSELFGHERGSYTSAVQSREGAFALANGGTLFLDEVGELPLNLQAELLRVLQEGTYKKVGSNNWQKTNFRLLSATNKDLRQAVQQGRFRQDLYYRIADCEFHVPSLKERKEDIPELVDHFLTALFSGINTPVMDKLVMKCVIDREFPGNIRELKQLVKRIALRHVAHKQITIGEVPPEDRFYNPEKTPCTGSPGNMQDVIRKALLTGENWWNLKNKISEAAIAIALDIEHNNKQKAAERLGVDVRTVQQYVKRKGTEIS